MKNFYMDDPVYPLDGLIEINSRCTTLPAAVEVEFRGFLVSTTLETFDVRLSRLC